MSCTNLRWIDGRQSTSAEGLHSHRMSTFLSLEVKNSLEALWYLQRSALHCIRDILLACPPAQLVHIVGSHTLCIRKALQALPASGSSDLVSRPSEDYARPIAGTGNFSYFDIHAMRNMIAYLHASQALIVDAAVAAGTEHEVTVTVPFSLYSVFNPPTQTILQL